MISRAIFTQKITLLLAHPLTDDYIPRLDQVNSASGGIWWTVSRAERSASSANGSPRKSVRRSLQEIGNSDAAPATVIEEGSL